MAGRDGYLDLLRGVAIVRVVLLHTVEVAWLSVVFPSMGVMFALGGSLMASSLDRRRGTTRVIRGRLRRLLPPMWLMAVIALPLMSWESLAAGEPLPLSWETLYWFLPLGHPPSNGLEIGGAFSGVLWYVRTYLWFVLLSPLLLRLFRLSPWSVVAASMGAVFALDLFAFESEGLLSSMLSGSEGLLSSLVVYLACWLVGFAHNDGLLSRMSVWVAVSLSTALAAVGLWWSLRDEPEIEFASLTLYDSAVLNTLLSVAFIIVLLRVRPGAGLLQRGAWLRGLSRRLNARAVTVYLWHYPLLLVIWWLAENVEFAEWFVSQTLALVTVEALLLLVAACVFGWAEDLAARRRPSLLGGGRAVARTPV
ncbi:acyltransferase [Nocardiopsis sp. CNR-923]|uniref:acyltransferase family protein n=1 Tax=Nocardiopsis sp. CNR-923 TaxID=1904965 RepID=UPI0021CC610D|nr:acyltransferase [Nocardiopsis sp. CNR-923]